MIMESKKMDLDRENHLLFEDDGYDHEKRKEIKRRFKWTPDLDAKFLEALILLGLEKASPNAILKHMNVPGLSHYRVARRLQIYQEKLNNRKKSSVATPMQEGHNYLQSVQSYSASKSFGLLTKSGHNDASVIQPNSLPKATNSRGIAFMEINNVKLRLQEYAQLEHQRTTALNNFRFRDKVLRPRNETIYDSGNEMQRLGLGKASMAPLIAPATMESQYNMSIMNSNNFGNQMQPPQRSWNYFPNQGLGGITMAPTMESEYMDIEIDSKNSGNNGSLGETMATIGTNGNNFSNNFGHENNGEGSSVNELEPYHRFGIPIEQWATGGPNSSDSSNDGFEDFN